MLPLSKLFFGLLLGLTLAAADPQPVVTLKMVVPLDPVAPFDQELAAAAQEFNATQKGVRIEVSKGGSSFETLRSLIAAHYATDLPDLAIINTADLETLDALGIVQPLPAPWLAAKRLSTAFAAGRCHSGEACTLPFQRSVPVWFFNRELLFKFGQATERIPTTWEKLSVFARAHTKAGEVWGVAVPETGPGAIERWSALGLAPQLTPETLSAWVRHMWENQGSWLPGSPGPDEATKIFLEQRAVVLLGTLEQTSFLTNNASFRIGTALPDSAELSWSGKDVVIFAKGRNAELTRAFLDYLYRPQTLFKVVQAALSLPLTRAQAESPAWKRLVATNPVLRGATGLKMKKLLLEKISPQLRDDVSRVVWEAVEAPPEPALRDAKADELRNRLQKKLSAIAH